MSFYKFYNKVWNLDESLKKKITTLGDKLQIAIPVMTLYLGMIANNFHYIKVFAICFAIAIFIAMLTKALFNNDRPRETGGYENPALNLDWSVEEGNSFISGHTISAMTGGIFWFYFDPFLGSLGLFFGLVTGFSRIVAKAHWLRDVVAAIIIAIIIFLVANHYFLLG